jgi:hypothetical protein
MKLWKTLYKLVRGLVDQIMVPASCKAKNESEMEGGVTAITRQQHGAASYHPVIDKTN